MLRPRDPGTVPAPIDGSVKRSCLEQRPSSSFLLPSLLSSSLARPQLQWRTDRIHKTTIIHSPRITTGPPSSSSNSIATSSARGMTGTIIPGTTTHTTTDATIHTAATMLTTLINRTKRMSRGGTITTRELLGTKTMLIETPQARRASHLCHRRRRIRWHMSTMPKWPKFDLEGNLPARESTPMCIRRRRNTTISLLQTEKFQGLESRRPREPMDEGKPCQNLRTLLLLHGNDYCVFDHQHPSFSCLGASSTE